MPALLTRLETILEETGLRHDSITIRMSGCPNGCGRPFISEIGIVGKGPDRYNVYLGGGHAGDRLNKLFKQDVPGDELATLLAPLFRHYASDRLDGEKFGNFVVRAGYVHATVQGDDFHKNLKDTTFSVPLQMVIP